MENNLRKEVIGFTRGEDVVVGYKLGFNLHGEVLFKIYLAANYPDLDEWEEESNGDYYILLDEYSTPVKNFDEAQLLAYGRYYITGADIDYDITIEPMPYGRNEIRELLNIVEVEITSEAVYMVANKDSKTTIKFIGDVDN